MSKKIAQLLKYILSEKGGGGILSYLQDILGGFCPSQQKRVGGIMSGGDFVRIPFSTGGQYTNLQFQAFSLGLAEHYIVLFSSLYRWPVHQPPVPGLQSGSG